MTTKPCSVCQHREVEAINAQLRLHTSLRKLEALFKVTRPSLSRHSKHVPPAGVERVITEAPSLVPIEILAATVELDELQRSNDDKAWVLVRAKMAAANLQRIAESAEKANALSVSVQAWAKYREYLVLIGEITGELERAKVSVTLDMRQQQWGQSDLTVLNWALARHIDRMVSFAPTAIEQLQQLAAAPCPQCKRTGCEHDSL